MTTNFRGKKSKLVYSPSFVALAFQNGLECCNADGPVNSGHDMATLCENLVNFDAVTPGFTMFPWLNCVQRASMSNWLV